MRLKATAVLATLFFWSFVCDAVSQDASDEFVDDIREVFQDEGIAEDFQILTIIGVTPGISGAAYSFEDDDPDFSDTDIKSVKIPLRRDIERGAFCFVSNGEEGLSNYRVVSRLRSSSPEALCATPYAELSLSYLRAEQDIDVSDIATTIDLDTSTLSALAGLGVGIPLSAGTTFRPILLAGYSRIESDAAFDGDFAAEFGAGLDGIADNAELDSLLIGGAAELRHERPLPYDATLEGRLRYNHIVSDVFNASDESLEEANDFIVVTGSLEASVPTGWSLFSKDVHALAFGGSNLLLSKLGEKINGEDFIHEIGGGLEIENPGILQSLRLRGSVLFGEDVFGWRAGLGVRF